MKLNIICLFLFFLLSFQKLKAQIGNTALFSNDNDFISIPDNDTYDPIDEISIETWVYTCEDKNQCLISKNWCSGNQASYVLAIENSKHLSWVWSSSGVCPEITLVKTNLNTFPIGEWVHVAIVHDQTGIKIYQNSVLMNTTISGNVFNPLIKNSSEPIRIGIYRSVSGSFGIPFYGRMDETRFWNKALTQNEIQSRMNTSLMGNETGLFAYYNYNNSFDGNNQVVNNNATLTGALYNGTSVGNANFPNSSLFTAFPSSGFLGNDTVVACNDNIILDASPYPFDFEWSTNQNTPQISVNSAGNYWLEYTNPSGCTKSDTISISVGSNYVGNINVNFCDSILHNGNWIYNNQSISDTILGANTTDCDSIINYNFILNLDSTFNIQTSCNTLDTGIVITNFTNAFGCDSVLVLSTTYEPIDTTFQNQSTCVQNDTGVLVTNFINALGCDSVFVLSTIYEPLDSTFENQTTCISNDAGINVLMFTSVNGCDSFHVINKVLGPNDNYIIPINLCSGDTFYVNNLLINQNGEYFETLLDINGCDSVNQYNISFENCGYCKLQLPDAFSPNNDGVNDVFKVFSNCEINSYKMSIYNRWGELVFKTFDNNEFWNGKYKNKDQAIDTYVYSLEYSFQDNEIQNTSGNVTIIR